MFVARPQAFSRIARQLGRGTRALSSANTTSTASTSSKRSPDRVRIVEVGPRDGLQNEKTSISPEIKTEFVRRLAKTGLETIEAGSFVHPKWVPQMANSDKILADILQSPPESLVPITYQWLLPNTKGLENFLSVLSSTPTPTSSSPTPQPRHEISIFTAATESFSHANTNCSISDSLLRFAPLFTLSRTHSLPIRAYISVALGCPIEGPNTNPHTVATLATTLLEMGAEQISIADTTGMGTAPRTAALLRTLHEAGVRAEDLACHFHDTYAMALPNTLVALEHGVRVFDAAVAGLGGCPFSVGATGNCATEDLVYLLASLGVQTGVDLEALSAVGEWVSREVGRANESRAGKATLAKMRRERERA